jgi:outer membrane protein TolC
MSPQPFQCVVRAFVIVGSAAVAAVAAPPPLELEEVLASVRERYPPYLAALIQQDIMNGRATQALGAFDTRLGAGGTLRPTGYYDGSSALAMIEQPLAQWGGSVYGGYRVSSGFLADYDKSRTPEDGQALIGFRLPLLRDGVIDKRRADLFKARIDQELADPLILRQHLDFIRAATIAYFNWVAAAQRLTLAEQLLNVANERGAAIAEMVARGAQAPIVEVDNQRLIVQRQIGVVSARRGLEFNQIELSLFHRSADDQPIRSGRERAPGTFPPLDAPGEASLASDLAKAMMFRPEIRRLELTAEKAGIDLRLARNQMLPNLDVSLEAAGALSSAGARATKDIERSEIITGVSLSIPVQRRDAKGQIQQNEALLQQLAFDTAFARDQIAASVRDAASAIKAAREQIEQTGLNADLALQLEQAEAERFTQGASDLLALQIREQITFDARLLKVEAYADFFRARAHYKAAVAEGANSR